MFFVPALTYLCASSTLLSVLIGFLLVLHGLVRSVRRVFSTRNEHPLRPPPAIYRSKQLHASCALCCVGYRPLHNAYYARGFPPQTDYPMRVLDPRSMFLVPTWPSTTELHYRVPLLAASKDLPT